MKLIIEQALQEGIAAHKEGRLQDAERIYREILHSEPENSHANHNLGVLAISANKAEAALPLFKISLKANPEVEQFWLSYIDALIRVEQFDNAKQVLDRAKQQGIRGASLVSLEAKLSSKAQNLNTANINPSQELLTSLNGLYQNGQFSDAEKLSIKITQDFPEHQIGWKVLGAVLQATGRKSEAMKANQAAVSLSPQDAEAHNNLGITLKELGRLDEALASYHQAIALKPDFAEAYNNLGNTFKELGRFGEAESSYRQALKFKPDFAKAHSNLGNTLKNLMRLEEAEASCKQAIAFQPEYAEAHGNLGIILFEKGDDVGALNCFKQSSDLKRRGKELNDHQVRLFGISKSKLNHDIEQFEYLASRSIQKDRFLKLVSEYSKIKDETSWTSEIGQTRVDQAFHTTLLNSSKLLHQGEAGRVYQALNGFLDINSIYERYFSHQFGLTYVDNFLSSDALNSLRSYLLESTIWFVQKKGGYLGAYLKEGLASPLILQIASELKSRFPLIIKDHTLHQVWAYKYDSKASDPTSDVKGINIHADFAAVNVNFWITKAEANLDPGSGGMVVYNTEAPKDWSFNMYNNNLSRIQLELSKGNGGREVIPHRENRMVIFNSNLFHETDKYHFKEGYENRRINVTMLFGRREDNY